MITEEHKEDLRKEAEQQKVYCELCENEIEEDGDIYELDDLAVCIHCYSHSREMDSGE